MHRSSTLPVLLSSPPGARYAKATSSPTPAPSPGGGPSPGGPETADAAAPARGAAAAASRPAPALGGTNALLGAFEGLGAFNDVWEPGCAAPAAYDLARPHGLRCAFPRCLARSSHVAPCASVFDNRLCRERFLMACSRSLSLRGAPVPLTRHAVRSGASRMSTQALLHWLFVKFSAPAMPAAVAAAAHAAGDVPLHAPHAREARRVMLPAHLNRFVALVRGTPLTNARARAGRGAARRRGSDR